MGRTHKQARARIRDVDTQLRHVLVVLAARTHAESNANK